MFSHSEAPAGIGHTSSELGEWSPGAPAGRGHADRVLMADANYSCSTNVNPQATLIHLNHRPGLVTVAQVR